MADLRLNQVVKRFGDVQTIHGVDLDIKNGEFVVFVGPSGCGKSTLLRLIAGLEEISGGYINIGGQQVNNVSPADRGIAMVFQSYALYPHMTVRENMSFGLRIAKVDKEEIERRVDDAARILQLEPLLDRKPKQLSGGQRQRVAIGRAIVRDPKVFLFDEPLSNLDAKLRVQMRVEIAKLHEQLGNTMIYVTHDQVEAMTMADKIVVLRDGRIEQVGTPLELYHHPANTFVAGFIGSPRMNFIPVEVTSVLPGQATLKFPDGQEVMMPCNTTGVNLGDKMSFGVRPEHIIEGRSGDLAVAIDIDVVERLGGTTFAYASYAGQTGFTVQADGASSIHRGTTGEFSFNLTQCHLFDRNDKAISVNQFSEQAA